MEYPYDALKTRRNAFDACTDRINEIIQEYPGIYEKPWYWAIFKDELFKLSNDEDNTLDSHTLLTLGAELDAYHEGTLVFVRDYNDNLITKDELATQLETLAKEYKLPEERIEEAHIVDWDTGSIEYELDGMTYTANDVFEFVPNTPDVGNLHIRFFNGDDITVPIRQDMEDFDDRLAATVASHLEGCIQKPGYTFEERLPQPKQEEKQDSVALDPQGNVVLATYGEDALVYRGQRAVQPFVVAHGYDGTSGEWRYGNYYHDLADATDAVDPDVIGDAVIRWDTSSIIFELKKQGVEVNDENINAVAKEFAETWNQQARRLGYSIINDAVGTLQCKQVLAHNKQISERKPKQGKHTIANVAKVAKTRAQQQKGDDGLAGAAVRARKPKR